jgi:regulator of sigma E protease
METLKVTLIIFEVLLLFNLLIAVHELGHFLAAKWRGLKIERFAIWFGKPIWKKKVGGVEYALGWIPAGGYVALPQMASMEAIEGKNQTPADQLPPISGLDKIIVAVAGPLFSFLLAVSFAVVVWGVGRPEQSWED